MSRPYNANNYFTDLIIYCAGAILDIHAIFYLDIFNPESAANLYINR